ncbi:hypothetical protein BT96DRAFT_1004637, partial [Gymnopus androsaceus JB14]
DFALAGNRRVLVSGRVRGRSLLSDYQSRNFLDQRLEEEACQPEDARLREERLDEAIQEQQRQFWLAEEGLMRWLETHRREVEKVAREGAAGGIHLSGTPRIEAQRQRRFAEQSSVQQLLQDDIASLDTALAVSIPQPGSSRVGASAELRGHLDVVTFSDVDSVAGSKEEYHHSSITSFCLFVFLKKHDSPTNYQRGHRPSKTDASTPKLLSEQDVVCQLDVLKRPWDRPECRTPSRINILVKLLYWINNTRRLQI